MENGELRIRSFGLEGEIGVETPKTPEPKHDVADKLDETPVGPQDATLSKAAVALCSFLRPSRSPVLCKGGEPWDGTSASIGFQKVKQARKIFYTISSIDFQVSFS